MSPAAVQAELTSSIVPSGSISTVGDGSASITPVTRSAWARPAPSERTSGGSCGSVVARVIPCLPVRRVRRPRLAVTFGVRRHRCPLSGRSRPERVTAGSGLDPLLWCERVITPGRAACMSDSTTIQLGGEEYLVQREGDTLRLGRQVGGDTTWLDEIDVAQLPGPAREALERGEHSDQTPQTALLGVVRAEVDRGA